MTIGTYTYGSTSLGGRIDQPVEILITDSGTGSDSLAVLDRAFTLTDFGGCYTVPETGGLLVIDAETGDLSEFTSTLGVISASTEAKKHGNYGFKYEWTGSNESAYGYNSITTRTEDTYQRCYFYIPSGQTWVLSTTVNILQMQNSSSSRITAVAFVTDGAGLPTHWRLYSSAGYSGQTTDNFSFDEWHCLELVWVKGTGTNGGAKLYVDGDLVLSKLDLDETSENIAQIFWGSRYSINPANGTKYYIDSCKLDSSYIGLYPSNDILTLDEDLIITDSGSGTDSIILDKSLFIIEDSEDLSGNFANAETGDLSQFDSTNIGADAIFEANTAHPVHGTHNYYWESEGVDDTGFGRLDFTSTNEKYARLYVSFKSDLTINNNYRIGFLYFYLGGTWVTGVSIRSDAVGTPVSFRVAISGETAQYIDFPSGYSLDDDLCIEIYYKASTGSSDGIVKVWFDGNLVHTTSDHDSTLNISDLDCGNRWNSTPVGEYFYIDDIKHSDSYIGRLANGVDTIDTLDKNLVTTDSGTGSDALILDKTLIITDSGGAGFLFVMDAETGDTSQWDVIDTPFAATIGSKYSGTYGFEIDFDGVDNSTYGRLNISPVLTEDTYVSFRVKFNSDYKTSGASLYNFMLRMAAAGWIDRVRIYYGTDAEGIPYNWRLHSPSSNYTDTAHFSLDEWHHIECAWIVGTGADDGGARFWIDGDLVFDDVDSDEAGQNLNYFVLGHQTGTVPDSNSLLYFDDVIISKSRYAPKEVITVDEGVVNKDVSDSGSGSDVLILNKTLVLIDTGSGTDPIILDKDFIITDSGTGIDTISELQKVFVVSDTATGTEQIESLLKDMILEDTGSGTDPPFTLDKTLTLSDSGSGSDSVIGAKSFAITDSGTGVDSTPSLQVSFALTDTGTGTDLIILNKSTILTDTGSGIDSITLDKVLIIIDSGSGTDSIDVLDKVLVITDSGSGTEVITVDVGVITVTDSGTGTDSITLNKDFTLSDSGSGLDVLISLDISASVSDSGQGLSIIASLNKEEGVEDSGSASTDITLNKELILTDSGNGSDSIVVLDKVLVITDVGNGIDAIILDKVFILTDSGNGTEVVTVDGGTLINVSDSGSGTDSIMLDKALVLTDNSNGSDSITLDKNNVVIDSGTGTEVLSYNKEFAITDIGSGTETIDIAKSYLGVDTGNGTDAIALDKNNIIVDSGAGVDSVSGIKEFTITDSSSGADIVIGEKLFTITDTGSGIDSIAGAKSFTIVDSGSGVDTIQVNKSFVFTDSGSGLETVTVETGSNKIVTDSGSGVLGITLDKALSISDTGVGSSVIILDRSFPLTDAGSGSSVIILDRSFSLTDAGVGSSAITLNKDSVITDAGSGSSVIILDRSFSLTDAGVGSSAITLNKDSVITDAGSGSSVIILDRSFSLTDAGVGSSAITLNKDSVITDAGSGSSAITLNKDSVITDGGSGTEIVRVETDEDKIVIENGTGIEIILINKELVITDIGSGLETIGTIRTIPIIESGSGSDSIALDKDFLLTDSGSGSESIDVKITFGELVLEVGTGTEAILINKELVITDSIEVNEELILNKELFINDLGTGTEIQISDFSFAIQDGSDTGPWTGLMYRYWPQFLVMNEEQAIEYSSRIRTYSRYTPYKLIIPDTYILPADLLYEEEFMENKEFLFDLERIQGIWKGDVSVTDTFFPIAETKIPSGVDYLNYDAYIVLTDELVNGLFAEMEDINPILLITGDYVISARLFYNPKYRHLRYKLTRLPFVRGIEILFSNYSEFNYERDRYMTSNGEPYITADGKAYYVRT